MSETIPHIGRTRSPRKGKQPGAEAAAGPFKAPELEIDSLDMEARGVGRTVTEDGSPGKVIFVEGALPGERVTYSSYRKKPSFEQAQIVDILRESVIRTRPQCKFFGTCGGCSMQHLDVRAQIAVKQRVLEDNLLHLAKLRPETVFRPIHGPSWGYRYRARLTVRNVVKKGGVLVGFHEKKSSYVADMTSCEVLPPHVSDMLVPLRHMVEALSIRDRMPQIELAVGSSVTALVLRILEPINAADEQLLRDFADQHNVQFWLQPKGPDTVYPFYPLDRQLDYTLPEFGIRMPFRPTDFTQVNHQINRVLVGRALRLLAPAKTDRVLDLFCGIGNFTLPLARVSREVVGIEGSEVLTSRALDNAKENGVDSHTSFACRNLFEVTADDIRALGHFDKYLIDPPREGALAVSKALADIAQSGEGPLPKRIVYVSCNPATLARDAGLLVHEAGYRLKGAGVVNMFPHTSHVESIALFERD
ncbi:23S rRNA (uracil(1939)-C(5))-methyltransferase RlmD [Paraburkholderia sp. LEh10]|uniref:23S rRNA (uracil(1939)-C(5))-methyltransferase RlmD n=1 Tax=Paraburkholderia sp. LEh10 TaxID=2821353 RepID=UPI001AE22BAA|nr:23S rRNA (uracil(1939)-C(5))-methyltransferase RlmD [Paraburkholderia sp. LEh10]MBP0595597.1 23S rRNA (uracil(1939)-C(5))-methyltransferase RlmD [Paraburkholderia sp. LEh10]